jgi:hypothetical protein
MEADMAKVIEFYIPSNFQKKDTGATQERGKVIEISQPKKSA